jgi:hypothetical protein
MYILVKFIRKKLQVSGDDLRKKAVRSGKRSNGDINETTVYIYTKLKKNKCKSKTLW